MRPRRALVLLPALLATMLLHPLSASAAPVTFADVAGAAHEDAVVALVDEGIVQGCETDVFCSRDELTRGQAATMLARTLDLPLEATGRFTDTAASAHAASIDALAEAELIAGCGDGQFCPQQPVTREQLATMLYRAFEVPDAEADVRYFDDAEGVHRPSVRALAAAGIAAGCTDPLTAFCATDTVQRAHAAMFLARTLGLVDRVEITPFEERLEAQERLDAEAEAARAAAVAEAAAQAPKPGEIAVDEALAQLGKPYRWGGSGPSSFDCSGLTSFAWRAAGVSLPHSSSAQYGATTRVSRSDLRPGDLVFYHSPISHVAMYIGDGRVVEAPNSGNNVRIREDGLTRRGVVGFGRP